MGLVVQVFKDNDTSQVLDTHNGTPDDERDDDYWLKCSWCGKWRRVPGSYKSENQNWLCSDNPNPTNCDDEQESSSSNESEEEQETDGNKGDEEGEPDESEESQGEGLTLVLAHSVSANNVGVCRG